ncbi:class F sortase [Tessaracoccus sp. MC1756]|uniref:class F sortase n=1 Tax=Tessaracoccus sp. MC1756 TaxID=2760311 RepID=UPI00160348B0|nr:class F sortase [Tessaracoccus sp. MC1756]MBB1508923.1 class F sortase [Tessaracoccus sp. MC1756]
MSQTPEPQSRRSTRLLVLLAAVVGVIALLVFALTRGGAPAAGPAAPAASSPAPASTTALPSPAPATTSASPGGQATPSGNPALAECTAVADGFVPQRFTIESLGADERVITLNLDKDGNIAAPPFDQPRTASWWSGGPKPGAANGKAVLSIHTYNPSLPPALGNEMYEGGRSQLEPGDVIKLYGSDGQVQCYQYTEAVKVWVEDYDPNSNVMVDFEGAPQLAIVICWDYEASTKAWDSRILFYADPVVPAT